MMYATALDEVQALRSENATLRREAERLRDYDVPYWRDVVRKELAIEIEKRDAEIGRLRELLVDVENITKSADLSADEKVDNVLLVAALRRAYGDQK